MTVVRRRAVRALLVAVTLTISACGAPARAPVPAPPPSSPGPLRVMTLGDSITFGGSATDHQGYRTPLGARLARAGVTVQWSNRGVNAATTGQLIESVDGWLAADRPDVVLLAVGTNDNAHPADIPGTAHRFGVLLDHILGSSPQVQVVMARIALSRRLFHAERERYINSQIPSVVAARAARVTLADFTPVPTTPAYSGDGIHPNDAGYALMAYQWYLALVPVLHLPRPTDDPWAGVPRLEPAG